MFKSYWTMAWRTLVRNKIYALVNVLGLALGICACLVIWAIVHYEFSFDRNHPDGSRIYRINSYMQILKNDPERVTTTVLTGLPEAVRKEAPIYMRLTINGQRLDQSIQRYVDGGLWSAAGRAKGNTEQVRQVNAYLDTLTGKVLKLEREMVLDGIAINFESFRENWLGITEAPRMLMENFQQHKKHEQSNTVSGFPCGLCRVFRARCTKVYLRDHIEKRSTEIQFFGS